jgi:redox-sensing transcriptional repressor
MGLQAIIVGAGDLGRALVRSTMFEKRGLDIVALFDIDPDLIGKEFGGVRVYDMKELEQFCQNHPVDMAVLTLPKEKVEEESARLLSLGVEGFWNFTGKELSHLPKGAVVENVHLGDSLMKLNYDLCRRKSEKDKKLAKE